MPRKKNFKWFKYGKSIPEPTTQEMLRKFWTKYWTYNKTIDWWVDACSISGKNANGVHVSSGYLVKLDLALLKLVSEKQFTNEKADELSKMLRAKDRETIYLAISIIQVHKPKKFKRDG